MRVQVGSERALHTRIVHQYRCLHDAYFDDRSHIPDRRLVEVRFSDLTRDPMGELERVYDALDLPDFAEVSPRVERYVNSLSNYHKSELSELDEDVRRELLESWSRSFDEWSYPTSQDVSAEPA
jgi:hypothetical protein